MKALFASVAILATSCAFAAEPKDACHLLTNAKVAAARVAAQFWKNEDPTTARAEVEGMVSGALDPTKRTAEKAVRYETLAGVGDSAVVAVAKRDAAAGVLNDMAVAGVVVGGRTITIFAPQLASGDPAKAIAVLSSLARSAAKG